MAGNPDRTIVLSDDRNYLEIDDVDPSRHPLIERRAIGAFHYLIAAPEILRHPAADVCEPLGEETSLFAEA